ncbi:MerR family transcriptional regulator [Aliamphritea spongicola]|uniref:MerR family transcriptional regulator n=1 Tax=Aliamphritea spongicola TaxID=707589 RepID=UPI00196AB7F3|nr:MerR family DNA-binding transcriptional regulator [Aliamphritea spongicola]MBN3561936.1 MerR family DNA-binding transcriptional regulator [Aliamphritea spongicola]
MSKPAFYTVPELARELGITPRTIRFYESKHLLSPERAGNTRIYTGKDKARLKLILRGKRLGFSLADIGEFLDLYTTDIQQTEQLQLLYKKVCTRIEDLENQQDALVQVLEELREIRSQCLDALSNTSGQTDRTDH